MGWTRWNFRIPPFNNVLWFFILNKYSKKEILCSEVDSAFPPFVSEKFQGHTYVGSTTIACAASSRGTADTYGSSAPLLWLATQGSLCLHCTGFRSSSAVTERPKGCSLRGVFGTIIIQGHAIPFHVNSKIWLYLDNLNVSIKMIIN